MAKQPTFYPNLPRQKRPKGVKRVGAILVTEDVRTPRIIHADKYTKLTGVYVPSDISIDTTQFQGSNVKAGTSNPNWRVTIAKGGDATSNYSKTHYRMIPTRYRTTAEDALTRCSGYGVHHGGTVIQENETVSLEDRAISRLRNKLQGKVGNAQLGPPLAESREIHRLVRQINGLGMDVFKNLLAAKASKGKSVAKQLGDIWLGFGFGVNPLLQDMKSAADSILHYVTRMDTRVVVTGTATRDYFSGSVSTSSSEPLTNLSTLGYAKATYHQQGVRYVAGAEILVRAGSNYSVADHLGLKLEALPSILWELTPYSWAVDYFTTVGSWLEDEFYTLPITVKYLSKNYKYQSRTLGTILAHAIPGAQASVKAKPSIGEVTKFTRVKLALNLPRRSLRIKTADEIASYGITKLLNLGSVIAGRHGPKL